MTEPVQAEAEGSSMQCLTEARSADNEVQVESSHFPDSPDQISTLELVKYTFEELGEVRCCSIDT